MFCICHLYSKANLSRTVEANVPAPLFIYGLPLYNSHLSIKGSGFMYLCRLYRQTGLYFDSTKCAENGIVSGQHNFSIHLFELTKLKNNNSM